MSHSLDLSPEAEVNSRLAQLRGLVRAKAPQANDEPLVPGIYFNADPESRLKIETELSAGQLLQAEFTAQTPARWLGLHIQLGDLALNDKLIFGVALRSQAPKSHPFTLCLRSAQPEGFRDTFFRKTAIAYGESSLHLDALMLAEHPYLSEPSAWRELILFFQPESGQIDLQDLRVFTL